MHPEDRLLPEGRTQEGVPERPILELTTICYGQRQTDMLKEEKLKNCVIRICFQIEIRQ
jgi:hypothetical protein